MGRRSGDLGQWRSRERARGTPPGDGPAGGGPGSGAARGGKRGHAAPDLPTVATSSAGHRLQVHRLIRIFCSSNGSARRKGREVGWALVPYEGVGE